MGLGLKNVKARLWVFGFLRRLVIWLEPILRKEIGLVVDLTDTHRYYNPDDFKSKGIEHQKFRLNFHAGRKGDKRVFPKPSEFRKILDKINSFHDEHPDKIVVVHW